MIKFIVVSVAFALFAATSIYDFKVPSLDGQTIDFSKYKGKYILVVNTASQCGYTKQYADLEKLYEGHKDNLVIVGFPANNFGGQEPGTNEEIKTFCSRNYNVTFPMMSKVSVKGADKTPLYGYLTEKTGGDIKWNFTKFLIDKKGNIVSRFESAVTPEAAEMTKAIEQALTQ